MHTASSKYKVSSVLEALNIITRGRVVMNWREISENSNPYVVTKTSHIPGKSVIEIPGLVFGNMEKTITKLGVVMTMTESVIELASAMGIELLVVHHPVAEAANSGGVPFTNYLPLYDIAIIELHEAFHGLHPGITFIHGHRVQKTDTCFGGIHGNVLHVGKALDEIKTAGDIIRRLDHFIGRNIERALLLSEREVRSADCIEETTVANSALLLNGDLDSPVKNILHFFPHTGFNTEHLYHALSLYPETDTLIASISRVRSTHPLVQEAKRLGLTFIVGNPHSVEILENGMPLAYALDYLLPGLDVYVLRERVTATPLQQMGHQEIQVYGQEIALGYLIPAGMKDPVRLGGDEIKSNLLWLK
ncbi:Nif3-like dinuclear metal center hexameric protein [Effusibacillus pohliae]|uniref:Nif3-like dinuclear metal center hexameric protein n=1 Tax=Effusibacillus pohliae TaxID=232270 RepID=UPI00036B3B46|nr:Nif3-like dinuclear metal center hexameric protein [Effusibacillus pohliae]